MKLGARRFLANLGLRVKEEREHRGLTQEQLAEIAGIDSRTLQRIESGAVDTGLVGLFALAGALHVAPERLLAKPDPRTKRRVGRPKTGG